VNEPAAQIEPELGHTLPAVTKIVQDTIDYVHAVRRMAILHLSADDCFASGEDPVRPF
jgi:hypothetical protein